MICLKGGDAYMFCLKGGHIYVLVVTHIYVLFEGR